MTQFAYSDNTIYTQIIAELGAKGLSSEKQAAVQNAIRESLHEVNVARPWTFRRAETDVTVTAATPYFFMPDDYDAMVSREICREDSVNGDVVTWTERTDRDFWRMNAGCDTGSPRWFRVVTKTVNSTQWYAIETVPPTDKKVTLPNVEYWRSPPALNFVASTPVTPTMPSEFHVLWKARALYKSAGALGRWRQRGVLRPEAEKQMQDAIEQYDAQFPGGPPGGVEDPYGDWGCHI